MSPKKTILRELTRATEAEPGPAHIRPATISGYAERPEKYQRAVNELLQSRLVEGRKDDEGHMTIGINQHRRSDVQRAIRPLWARPVVWVVLAAGLVLGAGLAVV